MNEAASLIDSNVWIALSFNSHPAHESASEAFALASAARPAAFCRATQQGIWMDAYLAAFAIANGMTVVTLDRGFASFEQAGLSLLLLS